MSILTPLEATTQILSNTYKRSEITLSTSWESEDATDIIPYSHYVQTVLIEGMKLDTPSTTGFSMNGVSDKSVVQTEYNKIIYNDTIDGGIKVYATEPTTIEIILILNYGG